MDLDKSILTETLELLNQIYVRNKNQHRLQKWWKWLSIFRRNVRSIVEMLESEEERRRDLIRGIRPSGSGVGSQRERLEQSVEWMRSVGVGRCYLAFSSLVADTQFSVLGVTLVAILARFAKAIDYHSSVGAATPKAPKAPSGAAAAATKAPTEDFDMGVVVQRTKVNVQSDRSPIKGTSTPNTPPPASKHQQNEDINNSITAQSRPVADTHQGQTTQSKKRPRDPEGPSWRHKSMPTSISRGHQELELPVLSNTEPKVGQSHEQKRERVPTDVPSKSEKESSSKATKKTKKKKKKGDDIDDLFAGLL